MNRIRHTTLLHASVLIAPTETEETQVALAEALEGFNTASPVLRSSSTGQSVDLRNAFHAAIESQQTLFEDLEVNGPPRIVRMLAYYVNDDDHFVVPTRVGPVRIRAIQYRGELRLKEILIPLIGTAEYRDAVTGDSISQAALFAPQSILGMKFSAEMHRMAETGETHVILRRLPDDA